MAASRSVWGYFKTKDGTGEWVICRKDIKLNKYKSTTNFWRHLKLCHPLEYKNLRNEDVSNNSKYSMCTTKETQNSDKQSKSGYWSGKNIEMDIPSRRSTCEDGQSNPKTKCLEYNQMDD